ncbi:MAG: hypothetical protein MRY83_21320 [Flavobacteriales bacterium]|nr:hypothetical protein [Flavobacteriales bacterium]
MECLENLNVDFNELHFDLFENGAIQIEIDVPLEVPVDIKTKKSICNSNVRICGINALFTGLMPCDFTKITALSEHCFVHLKNHKFRFEKGDVIDLRKDADSQNFLINFMFDKEIIGSEKISQDALNEKLDDFQKSRSIQVFLHYK